MTRAGAPAAGPAENPPGERIEPGSLWPRLVARTRAALASGALLSIPTDHEIVEDRGVGFLVRVLSNLERKDADKRLRQAQEKRSGRPVNPFLPYERELYVGDLTASHAAVLNKFNVVEHHLLIVTRRFEEQEALLTLADFEALWRALGEYGALGFYNGGVEAGASQRHKHLQVIPLPLVPGGAGLPMAALFEGLDEPWRIRSVPGLPFRNAFCRLPPGEAGDRLWLERTHERYRALLGAVGLSGRDQGGWIRQSGPYGFLATREWMFLVPRSREFFEGISVNSIGYAGGLLVRNEEQMGRVAEIGPMRVLTEVGIPL